MIRRLTAAADLDGLLADATAEGRDPVLVAGTGDADGTLAAFRDALSFPDWFGMNLDALADSLDDWAEALESEREVVWDGAAKLAAADEHAARSIGEILTETEQAHERLSVTILDR